MASSHGRFVWYELMTPDMDAATAFYGDVVGWGAQKHDMPGMPYTLFTTDVGPVAGLMTLPQDLRDQGVPPNWTGYVHVDDVDATAERSKTLGGALIFAPRDIPGVGRFAVIGDPQGAVISLFKWEDESAHPLPDQMAKGNVGWHELLARDWEAALPFYAELFGWQKDQAVDMGPMGTYQLFGQGGNAFGGMFTKPDAVPMPFWLYYFVVGDIDEAGARVKASGGQVINGPMPVPGGAFILQALDPQGAMFALVGGRAA
ncbi:VOC family protein [Roseixanthobacter pseudopolyaromaticivorans]|uniref:VOC family protein n=1 Tax=Xanthobacteraceae TaxID=335928 RepID=UPI003728BA98